MHLGQSREGNLKTLFIIVKMPTVCLYLHVHQPWRIKRYRHSAIGKDSTYFSDEGDFDTNNEKMLLKVAEKSYKPTNRVLLELVRDYPEFRLGISITGTAIEQLERFSPETLELFCRLVDTGKVEILAETYHHSLAFFYSLEEFERQVELHRQKVKKIFGVGPRVFRNTELAYNNELGLWADKKGYLAILTEGWDKVLEWRSPNFVYSPKGAKKAKLLLKNYMLSDDIAFRFSQKTWEGWPLTAEKLSGWVSALNGNGEVVNLFMDYETFGEHQWEDTGIFSFLRALPGEILKHPDNNFKTPAEVAEHHASRGELDVPHVITWADTERDLSAWTGNAIQQDALSQLFSLEDKVYKTKRRDLIENWRKLTTSDHFYYMCTKWFNDGDVHAYFNPYESPYDAFRYFMNVLADLKLRVDA